MGERNMANRGFSLFGYNMRNLEKTVWTFVLVVVFGIGFTFGFIYYPIHASLVMGSAILFALVHLLMSKLIENSPKKIVYTRHLFYLGNVSILTILGHFHLKQ